MTQPSMASISSLKPPKLNYPNPNHKFCTPFPPTIRRPSLPFSSHSHSHSLCRCLNRGWDSMLHDVVTNAINKFDSYINSLSWGAATLPHRDSAKAQNAEPEDEDENWDWDRWRQHFQEVDEQERLLSILKSELGDAVYLEDYEDAARLKVAIAAAATNDTVATVISHLNRAIEEERYSDAAFLRDKAGAGLVGWWAGISKDVNDPHGLIIRITPEHGRYVARSYSPRQLATSAAGVPLFEIFLTMNKKGEFKSQAVYLKRRGALHSPPINSSKALDAAERVDSVESPEDRSELFVVSTEDPESNDDRNDSSDPVEGMPGFQNVLKDMIPGVKAKVLKVTTPEKVDKGLISKVIEQIIEEEEDEDENEDAEAEADDDEDEEKDNETESLELEDIKSETDDEIEINSSVETFEHEEQNEIAVKFVIGGLVQKLSSKLTTRDLLRVPAMLETTGRGSFSFTVDKVVNQQDGHGKGKPSSDKSARIQGRCSVDHVMFDLAKFIGKGKVPSKVLKDVGELINLTLSQARNHQPLSGPTVFNRIEMPASPDPLNGLYIGAHGLYSSEVIQLRRRFGHWQEDGGAKEPSDVEFYEYVEALKLTGDPYVPAGQSCSRSPDSSSNWDNAPATIAQIDEFGADLRPIRELRNTKLWDFEQKVGKRYQLPHKGIIPEEFGVVARYKGQGRLAEPGFRNPRWVDGELVILDGKYIKAGPVVGFVYWAPEYHLLVFFNRLRLQQ